MPPPPTSETTGGLALLLCCKEGEEGQVTPLCRSRGEEGSLCFSRLDAALLEVDMEGDPLEVELRHGRLDIQWPDSPKL